MVGNAKRKCMKKLCTNTHIQDNSLCRTIHLQVFSTHVIVCMHIHLYIGYSGKNLFKSVPIFFILFARKKNQSS